MTTYAPAAFRNHDLERIRDTLIAVAAEELMPRFVRLQEAQISHKTSPFDVVTEADEAAERAIIRR